MEDKSDTRRKCHKCTRLRSSCMSGGFAPVYQKMASAICRRFMFEIRAPTGTERCLYMGKRRKYVRRDATVAKLSAIYLDDKTGKVKISTLECYQRNIRCHILPQLGQRVAAEVTIEDVDDYIEKLQESFSPKLVREVGSLLLAILRLAGINYTGEVAMPRVRQKTVEVFTEPELKRMGQTILLRPDETGVGVLLAAYTGIRLGELCGLQWQDVDAQTGLLHIRRTVERIAQPGGITRLTVLTPKTETSERWVPIPREMLRVMEPKSRSEGFLLTGGDTLPDPRTCQYRYKALLERCGVRYRSFHALRHTYATRCIEQGVDVKSVSELLGHSDVRTTLRLYVHSSMDYKRKAVESIGFLGGIE